MLRLAGAGTVSRLPPDRLFQCLLSVPLTRLQSGAATDLRPLSLHGRVPLSLAAPVFGPQTGPDQRLIVFGLRVVEKRVR